LWQRAGLVVYIYYIAFLHKQKTFKQLFYVWLLRIYLIVFSPFQNISSNLTGCSLVMQLYGTVDCWLILWIVMQILIVKLFFSTWINLYFNGKLYISKQTILFPMFPILLWKYYQYAESSQMHLQDILDRIIKHLA
jgi:hypothetical protein